MDAHGTAVSRLKSVTPLRLKRAIKAGLERIDPFLVQYFRVRSGHLGPIPPRRLRARVGGASISQYVAAGDRCARALYAALEAIGRPMTSFRHILDFGCGCGRTLQHLHRRVPGELIGCDVDHEAIAWMKDHYGERTNILTRFDPPLPFDEGSVDLVYSISIFTHLSETKQDLWLAELHRILEAGGIALVSTHGATAYEAFRSGRRGESEHFLRRMRERGTLEAEQFVYEVYDNFVPESADFTGIKESYGLTFHSHEYLARHWGGVFEVLAIHQSAVDGIQDLVVLRKR
jgi:SAM-dependent methyltransferase